jgi:hypothetical protein
MNVCEKSRPRIIKTCIKFFPIFNERHVSKGVATHSGLAVAHQKNILKMCYFKYNRSNLTHFLCTSDAMEEATVNL